MVFKGANGSFSSIAAMDAGRGKLEVNVGFMEKGFHFGRGFVVKSLEMRREAVGTKDCMASFVGSKDGGGGFAFHWFSMNEIGIIGIKDEELGVALTRG
jgi:hypothetical protein